MVGHFRPLEGAGEMHRPRRHDVLRPLRFVRAPPRAEHPGPEKLARPPPPWSYEWALFRSLQVVVQHLVNQSLRELDFLQLSPPDGQPEFPKRHFFQVFLSELV